MKIKKLNELHYGGAYDITNDMYFTRDDIVEFADHVVDVLNILSYNTFKYNSVYIENNMLEIELEACDYTESIKEQIDMRKIRAPKDLIDKYGKIFVDRAKDIFSKQGVDFGPHPVTENINESKLSFNSYVDANEITPEQAEIASQIDFRINEEDAILFIQSEVIDLSTVKLVRYTTIADNSYDGGYQVILKDGSKKEFGWKDTDREVKLYPISNTNNNESSSNLTEAKTGIQYKGYVICYGCYSTDRWYVKDANDKFVGNKAGFTTEQEAHEWVDATLDESLNTVNEKYTETVELNYDALDIEPVTRYGSPSGIFDVGFGNYLPDDNETTEMTVHYTYEVDKEDVITFLHENCITDADVDTWYDMNEEESVSWIKLNFDQLFDKYKSEILEYWEDDARTEAEENYSNDDYIDEQLNENGVSSKLPDRIDSFLQDVAQMTEVITYGDIMKFEPTAESLKKLTKLKKEWREVVIDDDEEAMMEIADEISDIIK